jgi:ABC-type branched-subunit amino acid transport system ATPase component
MLEVDGLVTAYGKIEALKGVSLGVERGAGEGFRRSSSSA